MNRRTPQHGFTLLELMITLIVLGTLLSLGVPAFTDAMERRQIQGAMDDLQIRLQTARSEAIKRSEFVSVAFSRTAADRWCVGLRNDDVGGCDCTVTATGDADYCGFDEGGTMTAQSLVFASSDKVSVSATDVFGGDSTFAFDPVRGTVQGLEGGDLFLSSENYQLRLRLLPTGAISVCDSGSAQGDRRMARYSAC